MSSAIFPKRKSVKNFINYFILRIWVKSQIWNFITLLSSIFQIINYALNTIKVQHCMDLPLFWSFQILPAGALNRPTGCNPFNRSLFIKRVLNENLSVLNYHYFQDLLTRWDPKQPCVVDAWRRTLEFWRQPANGSFSNVSVLNFGFSRTLRNFSFFRRRYVKRRKQNTKSTHSFSPESICIWFYCYLLTIFFGRLKLTTERFLKLKKKKNK